MLEIVNLNQTLDKDAYRRQVDEYQTWMRMLGYHLYYQKRPAVVVFEGWDAAGKGGAINRLTERYQLSPHEDDGFAESAAGRFSEFETAFALFCDLATVRRAGAQSTLF